jgi:glucose-1-phosphate thymidylyltransferase
MKAVYLASGVADWMYPLSKVYPKAMLEIGNKTVIGRLVTEIDEIELITKHIVITNKLLYPYFLAWKARFRLKNDIVIINDGTLDTDNLYRHAQDIMYSIENLTDDEDMLVVSCDMVNTFSIRDFLVHAMYKGESGIAYKYMPCIAELQKSLVVNVDSTSEIVCMHFRPQVPPTNLAAIVLLYFKGADLKLIYNSVKEGLSFSSPEDMLLWLRGKTLLCGWEIKGKSFIINDKDEYDRLVRIFANK